MFFIINEGDIGCLYSVMEIRRERYDVSLFQKVEFG